MKNFSHFIITRFNLKLYDQDKNKAPTRTEFWLKHRFELFEKYCLPSVAAQTCQDFVWLCLFDDQTPEPYRGRIAAYQTDCPAFYPVYYGEIQTNDLSHSLHYTISDIIKERNSKVECIITTNLDNDDSLSIYAIEELQRHIQTKGNHPSVYSFLYGYQYFTRNGLVTKLRYTNNHFLTLTEPYNGNEEIKTIVAYRHTSAIKQLPTVFIKTKMGMWLEVVHENNVSNEYRINSTVRYIPIMKGRNFNDFGLNMKCPWWKQCLKSLTLLPAGLISTGIRRLQTKAKRKKEWVKFQ